MSRNNIFRNDRVHVLARKCDTCIFHPGNRMQLSRGRVKELTDSALRDDTVIVCHETLYTGGQAICRGFYDRYGEQVAVLQIAQRMGVIAEVEPS